MIVTILWIHTCSSSINFHLLPSRQEYSHHSVTEEQKQWSLNEICSHRPLYSKCAGHWDKYVEFWGCSSCLSKTNWSKLLWYLCKEKSIGIYRVSNIFSLERAENSDDCLSKICSAFYTILALLSHLLFSEPHGWLIYLCCPFIHLVNN